MSGIAYCEIQELKLQLQATSVVCLVIAKSAPHTFESKNDGQSRSVLNITVRDSTRSTINCVIWGSKEFIASNHAIFRIGDIIHINNSQIKQKNQDNNYQPLTYSPYELTINEGRGFIRRATGEPRADLLALKNEIYKPTTWALKLDDIVSKGDKVNKELIDLVVAVRAVKPVRNLNTKFGERTLREVIVMDESCAEMILNIWDGEYVQRADYWTAHSTILHLIDIQADYSQYYKKVTLSLARRSVLVEDPINSSRATALQNYVQQSVANNTLPPLTSADISRNQYNLETIKDVMSIAKVLDTIDTHSSDAEHEFTALTYAVITKLFLDPTREFSPLVRQCLSCNKFIEKKLELCSDPNCIQVLAASTGPKFIEKFNITTDLTDHSGSLKSCRLSDEYAVAVLGHSIASFVNLSEAEIETLRWKFLLERHAVKIVVRQSSTFQTARIAILDCVPFNYTLDGGNLRAY